MPPRPPADTTAMTSEPTSRNEHSELDDLVPPFYNTTFSAHRVSPLYVGATGLTPARLQQLASRLRDTLVGDVVRGIEVGVESKETSTGQVDSLKSVALRWIAPKALLLDGHGPDGPPGTPDGWNEIPGEQKHGLWIDIRHENDAYAALLLTTRLASQAKNSNASTWAMRQDKSDGKLNCNKSHFIHLPLLLLRMPQALKSVISDWLSSTFDCHVCKLTLGTKTLLTIWEDWIKTVGLTGQTSDFSLTLAFNPISTDRSAIRNADVEASEAEMRIEPAEIGLKNLIITIAPDDLRRFCRVGEVDSRLETARSSTWASNSRERYKLTGGNKDDGWAWLNDENRSRFPFTRALASYLDHHLALHLFHPSVHVEQISCGAFVLARSRLKIVNADDITSELARAAWMFIGHLEARLFDNAMPSVF